MSQYRITALVEFNNGQHGLRVLFKDWSPVFFELTLNKWGEPVKGLILDDFGVAGKMPEAFIAEVWAEIKNDPELTTKFVR